jgi:hypothetical protein
MRIAPAVFLAIFALCACRDRVEDDFNRAFARYQPVHVAGADVRR